MKAKLNYIQPKVSILLVESENCFDKNSTKHRGKKKTEEL
jgi:hypothetical protein